MNVLLNAFRQEAVDHRRYRAWLKSVVNGDSAYGISPQVLCSFMRVSTHSGIFAPPSRLEEVLEFCQVLMEQPSCQLVQPGPRHWSIFVDLCRRTRVSGSGISAAWFAALAIEAACEWITADRDFARFPGLRWRPPF